MLAVRCFLQMNRPDETWHRLLSWTYGQAPSERLAAQILIHEKYENLDPIHPLGGKDGTKDAVCNKEDKKWVMAVYFPRNQQSFTEINRKFKEDAKGVTKNSADGMVFVTNQELKLSERKKLGDLVNFPVHIYHLERITVILDTPSMANVREKYIYISPTSTDVVGPDIHVSFNVIRGYESHIHPTLRKVPFINRVLPNNHSYGVVNICIANKGIQKAKNIKLIIYPNEFDSNSSISDIKAPITGNSWTSSVYLKFEFYDVNRDEIQNDTAYFLINFQDQGNIDEVKIMERIKTNSIRYELTCDDMPAKNGVTKIT